MSGTRFCAATVRAGTATQERHVKRFRSYAAWAALILPIVAAGTIVGLGVAGQIR